MHDVKAVAFDCDGVLADNDSSWQNIHDHFGTENSEMLAKFLRKEITDAEFVSDDIRMWREVQPEIHRDDIMRCYSGIKLMTGARVANGDDVGGVNRVNFRQFFDHYTLVMRVNHCLL